MWGSVTARGLRGLAFYYFESQDVNSALLLTKPIPDLNSHTGALSVSGLHTAYSRWVFLGLGHLCPSGFPCLHKRGRVHRPSWHSRHCRFGCVSLSHDETEIIHFGHYPSTATLSSSDYSIRGQEASVCY